MHKTIQARGQLVTIVRKENRRGLVDFSAIVWGIGYNVVSLHGQAIRSQYGTFKGQWGVYCNGDFLGFDRTLAEAETLFATAALDRRFDIPHAAALEEDTMRALATPAIDPLFDLTAI